MKELILVAMIIGAAPGFELETKELGRFDNPLSYNTALAHYSDEYADLRCLTTTFTNTNEKSLVPCAGVAPDAKVIRQYDGSVGTQLMLNRLWVR
jgi:hypothetical protein